MIRNTEKKMEPLIYWISLIGHVYVQLVINGTVCSYGLLYLELEDIYNESPRITGLVATIFAIFITIMSLVSGILNDFFGAWKMMCFGALVAFLGNVLSAFSPNIYLIYLEYGVFLAVGMNFAFVTSTTAVSSSFLYHRTLALGISFAGGSVGIMVYPLLFQAIVPVYTARGYLLINAGLFLNFLVVGILIYTTSKVKIAEKGVKVLVTNEKEVKMNIEKNMEITAEKKINSSKQDTEYFVSAEELEIPAKDIMSDINGRKEMETPEIAMGVIPIPEKKSTVTDKGIEKHIIKENEVEKSTKDANMPLTDNQNKICKESKDMNITDDEPIIGSLKENKEYSNARSTYSAEEKISELNKGVKVQSCWLDKVKSFFRPFLNIKVLSLLLWYFTYVFTIFGYLMYFPSFAKERDITKFERATLLTIYGATDLLSRIGIGVLGGFSKVSIYVLATVNMIVVGVLTLLLPSLLDLAQAYHILIVHMVILGLLTGGIYGLLGSIAVDAVGIQLAGTAIGFCSLCFGIAIALPPIIYGALKESTNSYIMVPYLSGAVALLCAVVVQIGQIPGTGNFVVDSKQP